MRLEYFQMLDRFVEVKADERWIRTESKVPMESPVFEGHFPGYPLMPGVLLIENMAQTCGWLVSAITGFTGLPVLAGVKEAKVRGAVFPGMELSTEGKIIHDGSGFAIADGKIKSGTTAIADARLTYRIIPYPSPEFQNTMVTWARQLDFPLDDFRKVDSKS
ncbi:3-hydroxyacyl-ACP dehydratase FabZ family protein [Pseudorhodoplanes sinuspersici]|uniref:Beta-hydroxyacyl-ACP dehydratase n=1 Tax=Pseudorhodoplanes sinuspersici TaxID=1235591 RepID=A0A1W6ZVI8_9HYPH|nr:3-hydroxyacyl-ACP dehydratase FabZ family protein [Pseudorhodoplanes sinuspersici]ARQ01151.1 beta-hydroxyacyl-ACP dehydratase [Pseudorhodoplanes sinuspersici]RKE72802.1 3-hydroxyacyl-[acyl-carrier-protein] dehydratase [Pseudorhodoplanes sinuspersici]